MRRMQRCCSWAAGEGWFFTQVSTGPCWKLIGKGSRKALCVGAVVCLSWEFCSAGDQRTLHASAFFVLKSLPQIQAKNEVPTTAEALCLKPGSTARWYQMRPCAVWPLVFVQTDVLMCCVWLDYLIVLVNHVSWASISLNVSLHLSSHWLQALLWCDCPVSALCLPRSSFSGRFVLSPFWTATLLLAGTRGNARDCSEQQRREGRRGQIERNCNCSSAGLCFLLSCVTLGIHI